MGDGLPRRVLIVDDHEDSREVVAMFLRDEGFVTDECDSAESALEVVRERPPLLVLTDLTLPGKSGSELAAELRRELGEGCPRILALTGRSDLDDQERAVFDGLLVKPMDLPRVVQAIRKLVG